MAKKTAKKKIAKKVTRKRQPKPVEELVEEALNPDALLSDIELQEKVDTMEEIEEIVAETETKEFNPETFRAQNLTVTDDVVEEETEPTAPRVRPDEIAPGEVKKKWRRKGKGSFLLKVEGENPRWIKPGQTFMAREKDIPEIFRNTVVSSDEVDQAELQPVKSKTKYIMTISEEDGSKFDVRNEGTGRKMNNSPLNGEEAESTLASLNN